MVDSGFRRSALATRGLDMLARAHSGGHEEAAVVLGEAPPRGQIVLRGDLGTRSFGAGVVEVLGVAPPAAPTTVASAAGAAILWLGPDEWLVVVDDDSAAGTLTGLARCLAGVDHAVVDVSHSRGVITVSGARARDVLAKGSAIDLHPREFGVGRCVQSRLARCHMLLHQVSDAPAYDLYVQRSFMAYAFAFLEDAGREYGLGYRPA